MAPPLEQSKLPGQQEKPARDRKRTLAAILMIFGVLVISYPIITEIYGSYVAYSLNSEWDRQLQDQEKLSRSEAAEQAENLGDSAISAEDAVLKQAVSAEEQGASSKFPATRIKIPKIDVEQVVLDDVTPEALKSGPGHYPGTPNPGQRGTVGIAGHRVTYTHPFNRIDELESGDIIVLETLDSIYEYRVVSSKTLDPDDLSALVSSPDGRAKVTLTTCTPKYSARYRLDVQATLVKMTPRHKPTLLRRIVTNLSKSEDETIPKNFLELAVLRGQESVAERPDDLEARIVLGAAYRNIGRLDDALLQLEKAIELDSRSALAHYQLALVYSKMADNERATAEFGEAIEIEPAFEAAFFRLGRLYIDMGRVTAAIEVFEQAVELNPLSADTRYFLGTAYEKKGRIDLARQEYEKAVIYVPDFSEAKAALRRLRGDSTFQR